MKKSNVSKLTIKAIKTCSYLGFRLEGKETKIEAVKRSEDQKGDPFSRRIAYFVEPIETKISDYTDGMSNHSADHYTGWAKAENYSFGSNPVALLGNILKEGDCLIAHWIVAPYATMQKEGRLNSFLDQLDLEIWRPRKNGDWKEIGGFLYQYQPAVMNETRLIRVR